MRNAADNTNLSEVVTFRTNFKVIWCCYLFVIDVAYDEDSAVDTESVITSCTGELSSPSSLPPGKSVDELLQVPPLSSFNNKRYSSCRTVCQTKLP